MSDPLSTYLHDHLGGAKAAIDLLEAMRDGSKDQPLKDFAAYLLIEVQADRNTLQRLAEKVGSGSNALKEFTGWLAEKVTRLKLGQGSGGDFGTFEPLEFLALGVRGKMGMWQALDVAEVGDTRLSGCDFKQLAARAEAQYQQVEQKRMQAARTALEPNRTIILMDEAFQLRSAYIKICSTPCGSTGKRRSTLPGEHPTKQPVDYLMKSKHGCERLRATLVLAEAPQCPANSVMTHQCSG